MRDALERFPEQFLFKPSIENSAALAAGKQLVICGMGGSHLSADVFNMLAPGHIRAIYSDYGLPELPDAEKYLYVMSSYSGNTEEVMESYEQARAAGLDMCAMAVGGALIEHAKADGVAHIQFPSVGLQPRAALGYGVMALAAFTGVDFPAPQCDIFAAREQGEKLAQNLVGKIPLVYASGRNGALAQNWKIKFNENTKIPAFWNTIPELNHNEMTGFDVVSATQELSEKFFVIMLRDADDHARNARRFEITRDLYRARGLTVHEVELSGVSRADKIFGSLMLADWTSVFLGEHYGVETEQVPMVEEFKKMIK